MDPNVIEAAAVTTAAATAWFLLRLLLPRRGIRLGERPEAAASNRLQVVNEDQLRQVVEESEIGPQVLFLYDPWCPISAKAAAEIARLESPVRPVNVSTGRHLTRAIEERFGVRHESPQVIVLDHGQAIWHASHFAIKAAVVAAAVVGRTPD